MKKDYYDILGIQKTASKEEIKKAFHKMAHKYHPDKNKGDDAKFKEVNEAYQTLSDDQKRAKYDQFGSGYEQYGQQGGYGNPGQGFGGFDFSGFQSGQDGFDMGDIGDIFSDFFSGGRQQSGPKRGRDIATEISIPFRDSIFGIERKILLTKTGTCVTCEGSGAKPGTKMDTCKSCNGKGQIHEARRTILGTISTQRLCDACSGLGQVPHEKCTACRGAGVLRKEEEVSIKIPAGINDGEMVRMTAMGEGVKGGTAGDLYIKINVMSHPIWKRDGSNLTTTLDIKLSEALLGSQRDLETLDGPLNIKIPEGITHGEILRVKERGVPGNRGKRGDLMIRIAIDMPKKLSRKAKDAIEKLKEEGI